METKPATADEPCRACHGDPAQRRSDPLFCWSCNNTGIHKPLPESVTPPRLLCERCGNIAYGPGDLTQCDATIRAFANHEKSPMVCDECHLDAHGGKMNMASYRNCERRFAS